MPELPEVETTIRSLRKKVLGRTFLDIWTDWSKIIKKPRSPSGERGFEKFKKEIRGKKIERIWRAGKNIIFDLSNNLSLLIHQKLTGHLLIGSWFLDNESWKPKIKGPLEERVNTYIHLLFTLDSGEMLALSDLRKFAKVELWKSKDLKNSKALKSLGPDPFKITFEEFKEILKKKKNKIKQVLMDQTVVAGIGNIYSDEILFAAKIHPLKTVSELNSQEIKKIYRTMKEILKKAIKVQGESISDYRTPLGEKGGFDKFRKVYRREKEKCSRCRTIIKKIKISGRSAHFCPRCQKL